MGGCCYGGGRGSGTVCAFDGLTDMQTLILLECAQQAFSCVSTAIIVVTINLMVLKVQDLYPESLRSSVTLCQYQINVTKVKRDETFPAKSPLLSVLFYWVICI